MSQYKNIGATALILLLAFVVGFKGDLLSGLFASEDTDNAPLLEAPSVEVEPAKRITKPAAPVSPVISTNKAPHKNTPTSYRYPSESDTKTTPHNPYAEMMKAAAEARKKNAETFSGTMDSIRPGQIGRERQVQRNAYFDKLSQQLKDLRGENPPAAKDIGAGNVPAAPGTGNKTSAAPRAAVTQPSPSGMVIPDSDPGKETPAAEMADNESESDGEPGTFTNDEMLEEELIDEEFLDEEEILE